MLSTWGCCAAAGLLGALSASSAKFALGADYMKNVCEVAAGERAEICEWVHFILRLGCAGLVFAFNAAMWTFFAKALRYSSSSAAATVTTTASNFVSSVGISVLTNVDTAHVKRLSLAKFCLENRVPCCGGSEFLLHSVDWFYFTRLLHRQKIQQKRRANLQ
ncbi:transmembrane protein 42 isoform X1 [Phyllobates terribilis]|uniref:transmembrane protein 42 isoform X1 n=1 Tax=Phyllobates terribilis TaxID=111132 RepID=UPI003CCB5C9C